METWEKVFVAVGASALVGAGAYMGYEYVEQHGGLSGLFSGGGGSGNTAQSAGDGLAIPQQDLGRCVVGKAFSATLRATGGKSPYAWSASGLPPGLAMSSSGLLSGKPTRAGSYTVTISVTDANSQTAVRTTPFVVSAA